MMTVLCDGGSSNTAHMPTSICSMRRSTRRERSGQPEGARGSEGWADGTHCNCMERSEPTIQYGSSKLNLTSPWIHTSSVGSFDVASGPRRPRWSTRRAAPCSVFSNAAKPWNNNKFISIRTTWFVCPPHNRNNAQPTTSRSLTSILSLGPCVATQTEIGSGAWRSTAPLVFGRDTARDGSGRTMSKSCTCSVSLMARPLSKHSRGSASNFQPLVADGTESRGTPAPHMHSFGGASPFSPAPLRAVVAAAGLRPSSRRMPRCSAARKRWPPPSAAAEGRPLALRKPPSGTATVRGERPPRPAEVTRVV